MKRIITVLLAALLLTVYTGALDLGEGIELPDIPVISGDDLPECSVSLPKNCKYDLTLTVKSASAKDLKKYFPDEFKSYKDSDIVPYINVCMSDVQYAAIEAECGGIVYLCNLALNGVPVDFVFEYENEIPFPQQFQILMPKDQSVLTLDYFGELEVTLSYQNETMQNEVLYAPPYGEIQLPYPECGGKTPVNWNTMPDGTGMVFKELLYYSPEPGTLWSRKNAKVTLYAMWEEYDPVIAGDINDDGQLDNKDVVSLFRLLSAGNVDYLYRYDFNNDGEINNKDVVSLFRFLSTIS